MIMNKYPSYKIFFMLSFVDGKQTVCGKSVNQSVFLFVQNFKLSRFQFLPFTQRLNLKSRK